jgi:hypothetical protein
MRRFRLPLALAAALVLIVAAYAGWWWFAASTAREEVAVWTARERAAGSQVNYAALNVGGFPFLLRVTATDFALVRGGGLSVSAPLLEVSARPWSILDLTVTLPTPFTATIPADVMLDVTAPRASGFMRFGIDGQIRSADVAVPDVVAKARDATSSATIARIDLDLVRTEDGGLRGGVMMTDLDLPAAARLPLGRKASLASVRFRAPPPVPMRLDTPSLASWTQGGGRVLVERGQFVWGPLAVNAEGWVALDGALQPIAQITGRVAGYNEALEAFAAAGFLRDNLTMARTVLNLMAAANPNPGTRPEIVAGLTIQDRWVTLGPVRLGRLQPIAWPP